MLLAFKDKEGTIPFGTMYNFAVAGAFIAELLLTNRIKIKHSKSRKKVVPVSNNKFGDPLLDECLEILSNSRKERDLKTWINRFANMKKLKNRTAKQLCKRGILRSKEKDVLLIFKKRVYPEINPEPERKLLNRLEKAIFSDRKNLDPRTIVIISLAHKAGILPHNFDKKRLKKKKDRIEKIIEGEIAGKVTEEAIKAMQAAIMAATTAATTAAIVSN